MADSTTVINACNAVLRLDDDGGDPVNISGVSNEFTLDFSKKLGEYKTFGGSGWFRRLECGKDANVEVKIVYSTNADEGVAILKEWYFTTGGLRTFQVALPDGEIGSDSYTGEFLLENFNISGKADEAGPVMVSMTLKPSGPVDWALLLAAIE